MFGKDNKIRIKEFIDGNEDFKELKKLSLRDFLNGEIFTHAFVTKKLGYMLFIALLAFLYISNHYKVEKSLTELTLLNKELKELKSETITTSSELMQLSKQSQIVKRLREAGTTLEPLSEPPRLLEVD